MSQLKLLLSVGLGLAALALHAEKPNVIVIMADDLGYADVGFNGCKDIPTPNIDTLAQEGANFTNAYVTYPVCGPSRAGFITGRYQQRFGFERNPQYKSGDPNMGLPRSEETIATILGKAGYTSGIIGKWHLGAHETLHPLERGFDYFYGHLGGGHNYFQELLPIREDAKDEGESYKTWILRNHEPVKIDKYLTDVFSDEAVTFIERHKDDPFFLFLSYNAPHTPMQAPEEEIARFVEIKDPKRRTYAAMVSIVDRGVGQVMDKLKELDLDKETLVFFLSDNGGPIYANGSNNKPLRGAKSDVWEGGWRVPFVLRWTGEVEPGSEFDEPVSSMDILGTMAGLTGVPIAEERPLDGVNLIPFLKGEQSGSPHEVIYLRKFDQKRYAVRKGDFKLVIPDPEIPTRLFNLSKDIGEKKNIADWNARKLEELDQLRLQWDAELMEPQFLGLIHSEWWKKQMEKKKN
ncbi:sulfatase-like hydrolase/transferase [Puniceicoccales bacterium CK1056]|uniref:Sulfatase-like hydrolase/transferase n=1 Tax=Oceanipulchritudo coccoides TaxID=2706888 RepID=A0A6B2LYK4_9BACT|nr:sulfatase-like hydrolase/transferase [Oceanipulchritudo coccoides]NDV61242.1 sulfatase-like hydrolase/transferase [Oceanipulchritudo coccoides]